MNLVLVGRAMGSVPYRSGMLLTTTVSFVSKKEKLSIKLFTVYDFYCCSLIDICQDPSGISQKISTLRTSSVKFESWSAGTKHCGPFMYHPMSYSSSLPLHCWRWPRRRRFFIGRLEGVRVLLFAFWQKGYSGQLPHLLFFCFLQSCKAIKPGF